MRTYITASIGSVTSAARLARLARAKGADAAVVQTPSQLSRGGCAYSIRIAENEFDVLSRASQESGIKIKKLFKEEVCGRERIYHDIS